MTVSFIGYYMQFVDQEKKSPYNEALVQLIVPDDGCVVVL
jgi:hypothetical protein